SAPTRGRDPRIPFDSLTLECSDGRGGITMSDSTHAADNNVRWGNAHQHFLRHLAVMPSWHKAVIVIAGLVALLGTIGQIFAPRPAAASPPPAQTAPAPQPNNQRSFASGAPRDASSAQPA